MSHILPLSFLPILLFILQILLLLFPKAHSDSPKLAHADCSAEIGWAKEVMRSEDWQKELEEWKGTFLEKKRQEMEAEQRGMARMVQKYEHCENVAKMEKEKGAVEVLEMEARMWKEMATMLNWDQSWHTLMAWKTTAIAFMCLFALALLATGLFATLLIRQRLMN